MRGKDTRVARRVSEALSRQGLGLEACRGPKARGRRREGGDRGGASELFMAEGLQKEHHRCESRRGGERVWGRGLRTRVVLDGGGRERGRRGKGRRCRRRRGSNPMSSGGCAQGGNGTLSRTPAVGE